MELSEGILHQWLYKNYGGPEIFEQTDCRVPVVKPGYALVKVATSDLNLIETKILSDHTAAIAFVHRDSQKYP